MRNYFAKLSKLDWVSLGSSLALILLTFVPIFWDVDTGSGWLRNAVISLAAVALTAVVTAQISLRDRASASILEVGRLSDLVESAIDRDAVHEVPARQINQVLTAMLTSSNEWYFRGGSARWQREAVLPTLAAIKDRPVKYYIQIISPFDPDLCDKYAAYRKKSRPEDPRADPQKIRLELLAFIYATSVWASRSKISPQLTLLHRFSPFRLDGNSEGFIITVADPAKNGLQTKLGNWYHASLLDEFEFEAGYATPLNLPSEASDADGANDVRQFFDELKAMNTKAMGGWKSAYSSAEWAEVFRLAGTRNVGN